MAWWLLAVFLTGPGPAPIDLAGRGPAQMEIDRILSKVNGVGIRRLDVRQAVILRLVDSAPTDGAVLAALENRLLMLGEVARLATSEPAAEAIDRRHAEWLAAAGAAFDLDGALVSAGWTARDLRAWHRDDVRIGLYVRQRFGSLPDDVRVGRVADWIRDLRERAGLK
jgi:hypothetical protein